MLLSEKPRITVYADISCPFCFVLHERLLLLDVFEQVQWRTIEHAPGANSAIRDPRQMEQLNEEYRMVVKRGPDVKVLSPGFIPNTALVNQYLGHVAVFFPERLLECRTEIYRALWQKGLDISNRDVLWGLLSDLGVEVKGIGPEVSETLARWQRKWQFADYDQRIPVMLRDHTEVMLGLQNPKTIASFINFNAMDNVQHGNVCHYINKDVILVLCAQDHQVLLQNLAEGENATLHFCRDSQALKTQLENKNPDLIILDEQVDDSFALCKALKEMEQCSELPLVFVSGNTQRDQEKLAFKTGAVDYICLQTQSRALFSRLKNHIQCKHRMEILTDHATHDALTGLYNKRELENCLEREWRYACRYRKTLAVLMLDIDHFKAYNDHYGHPAGDEAMIKVANAISESIYRGRDVAARFGGEEFAVILPDVSLQELETIAQRILIQIQSLKIVHQGSSTSAYLSISIGGALTKVHADNNYNMLVKLADEGLYQAKNDGRNCIKLAELPEPKY